MTVKLSADPVRLCELSSVARHGEHVEIEDSVRAVVAAGHRIVLERLSTGELAYGVNTGLGPARDERIPADLLAVFQEQIISTHAASLGPPMSRMEARATLFARLVGMARGGSGGSPTLFAGLERLLNSDIVPIIPVQGSVGAADLVQMASIGNVLLGRGQVMATEEATVATSEAFREHGFEPIRLQPKDALALIGANAASLGMGSLLVRDLGHLLGNADVVAALTVSALDANDSPFAPEVIQARPLPGQIGSAARLREALRPPQHVEGDLGRTKSVQDPLSIRTIPQVHGAAADQLAHCADMLSVELNSRAENPLVLVEDGRIISNGNFSIIGLAIGFEAARLALAHVGMLTERRIAMLAREMRGWATLSDQLRRAEWRERYMAPILLQNTASALVAELKHAAAPVTVMGTAVADGVEDHNSMCYSAISLTKKALATVRTLQAIEALLATDVFAIRHPEPARPHGGQADALFDLVRGRTAEVSASTLTAHIVTSIVRDLEERCLTSSCFGDEIIGESSTRMERIAE